jgi:mannan endo-1,4-beta-mannosidase
MEMSSLAVISGGDPAAIQRWGHLVFGAATDLAQAPAHAARRAAVDARLAADAAMAKAEQARLATHWGLPANPNASEDVHKIVAWLAGLRDRKEKRFIVGMADGDPRAQEVFEKSGCWPAMRHFSYTDPVSEYDNRVSPGNNEKTTSDAIATWKDGRLVHIHINPVNPWNGRHIFEPNPLEGREKIAELLVPGNAGHDAWIKKLDAYAKYLAELRDAGVVVLWRPLHEMGFPSMYWYDAGATKDREVFKNLWRQMFRYLTYEKKLDNLVWIFGAGGGPAALDMYPGPEYVDLVGFSLYNAEVNVLNNEYEHMLQFGKPFAFTEFGNWIGPVPGDALDLIRGVREKYPLATFSVHWGSWPGAPASLADSLNVDKLMKHPWVITRENLDWRATKVDLEKSRARKPVRAAPDGAKNGGDTP